jgi:alpha-L-fucosidase 2
MVPAFSNNVNMKKGGGLYVNLFDAHPPFQIDGNFGATSGITEMLLQSHLRDGNGDFYQDLLPALPGKLASGNISGIKGRGGFEFTIDWTDGKLVSVKVKSLLGNKLNLRYAGKIITKNTSKNENYTFKLSDF